MRFSMSMSSRGDSIRICLLFAAIVGAMFASWLVPLTAMLLVSVRWSAPEVPFIGFLVDLLYLPAVGFLHPLPLFTLIGISLAWIFEPLRRRFLL